MMKKGAEFSSSRYIAPLHESQEEEASHLLMKPVVYCNFYTDGMPAQPIFGLKGSISQCESKYETLSSAGYVSSLLSLYRVLILLFQNIPLSIEKAFEMEKSAKEDSGIQDLLREHEAVAESSIVVRS